MFGARISFNKSVPDAGCLASFLLVLSRRKILREPLPLPVDPHFGQPVLAMNGFTVVGLSQAALSENKFPAGFYFIGALQDPCLGLIFFRMRCALKQRPSGKTHLHAAGQLFLFF